MKSILFLLSILLASATYGQVPVSDPLYKSIKTMDSLIFDIGFNQCNISVYDSIISEDLEFYHDQSGMTTSRDDFIKATKNNICGNPEVVVRRELLKGSMSVYPLYNNGTLYGAIQMGTHRFFQKRKGAAETPGSVALFTHLWLKQNEQWILKRVLSYDHQSPK